VAVFGKRKILSSAKFIGNAENHDKENVDDKAPAGAQASTVVENRRERPTRSLYR